MTVEALLDHLASEHLDLEAFERRRDAVARAATVDELRELLDDLPGRSPRLGAAPDPAGPSPYHAPPRPARALVHPWSASWAGADRPAPRRLPERLWVVGALGGTSLDLRHTPFPPGPTEIRVVASLGRVRIVLPEDVPVEVRRVALPGRIAWEEGGGEAGGPAPAGGPRVRIVAVACLGAVAIEGGRRPEGGA